MQPPQRRTSVNSVTKQTRIAGEMLKQLEAHGFRAAIVSLGRLKEINEDIDSQRTNGRLDPTFDRECLSSFDRFPPDALPDAASLIVVAAPQPSIRLTVEWNGRAHSAIIPPTYSYRVDGHMNNILSAVLDKTGYQFAPAYVPKKLAAVRCGLAEYGRNNLAYIEGMGSFFRLVTFYTNLPCHDHTWVEPRAVPLCGDCTACLHKCPTNAIDSERFLIKAERCLTYHNEREVDFPSWLHPSWHHCLIGCLVCQDSCPLNRKISGSAVDAVSFNTDETALLLRGEPLDRLPPEKAATLSEFRFMKKPQRLARNLKVLLESQEATSSPRPKNPD